MSQPGTGPVVNVSNKALKHNREFTADQKKGNIIGCHDLTVMMKALKKDLILVRVKNTPECGFPEGVYSLQLTLEKTTGERTDKSVEALATGTSACQDKKSKRRSRTNKSGIGSEVFKETEATGIQSNEAHRKGHRGKKEKKGGRKKSSKQGGAIGKLSAEKEEKLGRKTDMKYGAAVDGARKEEAGESTSTKEGAAGGGTCTEEGAAGGGTCTEEGAAGGGTCTEEGAAGEGTCTEEGAAGGGNSTEEGAAGEGTCTEEGAAGGGTCTEEGAAGGGTSTEEGATGEGTCTTKVTAASTGSIDKGDVLGKADTTRGRHREKEKRTFDLTLLSEIGDKENKKVKWEVEHKTVFKPVLKTVYDPNNWTDEQLKLKCQKAFRNALNNETYEYITESEDTKGSRIYWEGCFQNTPKCFWIAGFSDRLKPKSKKCDRIEVEDFVVNNFYFIHDSDKRDWDE